MFANRRFMGTASRAVLGLAILFFTSLYGSATAEQVSYHLAHPLGWMHSPPVGTTPGWSSPRWFNLEISQANIWSTPFSMTDKRTGDVYAYRTDFEQTSAVANFGWALSKSTAIAFAVPYANHNSGFLDEFIDQFHRLIQVDRFERQNYQMFGNRYSITKNGIDQLRSSHAEGVGSVKMKLKYWFYQLKGGSPGVCDCGLAIAGEVKVPTQTGRTGLSSGGFDYTAILNAGVPLGANSGFWFTSALTRISENEALKGWPTRKWLQMYEGDFNLGLNKSWSVLLRMRYESPLLEKEHLEFNYNYTNVRNQAVERVNSAWNSLVHWRGSQSFGFQHRWNKGNTINLMIIEDWGRGKFDSTGALTYINNAPDVQFVTQWHFAF